MASNKRPQVPKYCRRPNGQAYLCHRGERYYLGKFGSPESHEAYDQFVAELAISRQTKAPRAAKPGTEPITINTLCLAYLDWAEGWYVKDGKPTSKLPQVKGYVKTLRSLYGSTRVPDFGPLALQAVQAHLVGEELTRGGVNARIGGIRRIFKWGVAQELVPADVYRALMCVSGLRKGRTPAPEPPPVGPVDDAMVDATLPALSAIVADMVQFQRLTGACPDQVSGMLPPKRLQIFLYVRAGGSLFFRPAPGRRMRPPA